MVTGEGGGSSSRTSVPGWFAEDVDYRVAGPGGGPPEPVPNVVNISGNFGMPSIVATPEPGSDPNHNGLTTARAQLEVRASAEYDSARSTTTIRYDYTVKLRTQLITFFGGAQPNWTYRKDRRLTLLDHEKQHAAFNEQFFSSPYLTILFFQAAIPFAQSTKGRHPVDGDDLR
jgi:hypothetical protein